MASNNRMEWNGLRELKEALRKLPRELADDASPIIHEAAERAVDAIAPQYPEVSGNLRAGLGIRLGSAPSSYGTNVVVFNRAYHAHLYENGTEAVRLTDKGWSRGRMPARHVFVPPVVRERRQMYEDLKAMLEAHGLEVSGDA